MLSRVGGDVRVVMSCERGNKCVLNVCFLRAECVFTMIPVTGPTMTTHSPMAICRVCNIFLLPVVAFFAHPRVRHRRDPVRTHHDGVVAPVHMFDVPRVSLVDTGVNLALEREQREPRGEIRRREDIGSLAVAVVFATFFRNSGVAPAGDPRTKECKKIINVCYQRRAPAVPH